VACLLFLYVGYRWDGCILPLRHAWLLRRLRCAPSTCSFMALFAVPRKACRWVPGSVAQTPYCASVAFVPAVACNKAFIRTAGLFRRQAYNYAGSDYHISSGAPLWRSSLVRLTPAFPG